MPIPTSHRTLTTAIAVVAVAAGVLAGCADDDTDADAAGTITVQLSDFSFGDLPQSVPAGTELAVSNTSDTGLHELVAFRLDEDDERPIDEVLADTEALLASEPALVALAAPGSDEQIVAVGNGTLSEPGRYLIACFIPTGVDPDAYLAAAATSDGPPEVAGGPPHIAHGMVAELQVT